MGERLILALDCGSTNLKAGLFNARLQRLAEAAVSVTYTHHGPERYEFAAEGFWQNTVDAIRSACLAAKTNPRNVTDVALSSQAQSFLFVDSQGHPLTPVVSWLDRAATESAARAEAELGSGFHRHCSCPHPIPQLQLCKVRQSLQRQPALAQAQLLSLPGWLGYRLGAGNVTDDNLAAMGGLYSLELGDWWPEALTFAGLQSDVLPRLVSLGKAVATTKPSPELGFSAGLRIVYAGNDQTSGAYGNGIDEDTTLATLGTALVAYRCAGTQPGPYHPDSFWGPYPNGRYYELATRDEGCLALDVVRGQRFLAEFDRLAASYRPQVTAGSAFFWPARVREFPKTDRADETAYATLEGIAFALRGLLEDSLGLRRGNGTVKLAGGGGKSAIWRQIIADVLDCTTVQAHGDSLLGAAAMAAGMAVVPEEAGEICSPDPAYVALLDERYQRWRHG